MIRLPSSWRSLWAGVLLLSPFGLRAASGPVEFRFEAPPNPALANPYARALWGEVTLPSGRRRLLPAFASGEGWFGIRARPEEQGRYTLGEVTEEDGAGRRVRLAVRVLAGRQLDYRGGPALPAIQIDSADRHRFRRSDGSGFVPVGSNLAWATDHTLGYHLRAIQDFAAAGMNWMRVWMAHWNGLNLDWLSAEFGRSPPPGTLDEGVARRWDALLEAAEANGVYLQVVLQHHGQYTTYNDSNWAINPWNAA
ncbi:MAG TPA: hypothetical protein VHV47_05945, partial [Opitutaceae bacterium]|nr:hypothetical protein [Opitutaceae bacterium]